MLNDDKNLQTRFKQSINYLYYQKQQPPTKTLWQMKTTFMEFSPPQSKLYY